jgi:hypothetical protein
MNRALGMIVVALFYQLMAKSTDLYTAIGEKVFPPRNLIGRAYRSTGL